MPTNGLRYQYSLSLETVLYFFSIVLLKCLLLSKTYIHYLKNGEGNSFALKFLYQKKTLMTTDLSVINKNTSMLGKYPQYISENINLYNLLMDENIKIY